MRLDQVLGLGGAVVHEHVETGVHCGSRVVELDQGTVGGTVDVDLNSWSKHRVTNHAGVGPMHHCPGFHREVTGHG